MSKISTYICFLLRKVWFQLIGIVLSNYNFEIELISKMGTYICYFVNKNWKYDLNLCDSSKYNYNFVIRLILNTYQRCL